MFVPYHIFFQNINGERKITYIFIGQVIMEYYPQRNRIEASKLVNDLGRASEFIAEFGESFRMEGSLFSGIVSKYELDQFRRMNKKGETFNLKTRLLGLAEKAGVNLESINIPRL